MLIKVQSECPDCKAAIQLTVSTGGKGKTTGSVTKCSACGVQLVTRTENGVRVIVSGLTGTKEFTLAIDPTSGGEGRRPQQKYLVFAPNRLELFRRGRAPRAEGVSDEGLANRVTSTENILWRPNGEPRAPAEAARFVGWRTVWIAQLNDAIRERLAGPPPITDPPAIFLSYRWGAPEQVAWVSALANELKRRGYPVVFDRDEPQTDNPDVPQLVSRIASCRYMLCVIDPGYVERLGGPDRAGPVKDGWVFDEVNTARHFQQGAYLTLVGLLRDGDALPSGFSFMEPNVWGNAVDVRAPNALKEFLDDAFPGLPVQRNEMTVLAAQKALTESHEAFLAGDVDRAFAEADRVAALLPEAPDGYAQLVRLAINTQSHIEQALFAIDALLGRAARSTELRAAAALLCQHGRMLEQAARHARCAIEQYRGEKLELGYAHLVMADALDERDSLDAALAHGRESTRLIGPNKVALMNVGYILRRLGRPGDALEVFDQALTLAPDSPGVLTNAAGAAFEAGLHDRLRSYANRLSGAAPDSPAAQFFQGLHRDPDREPQLLLRPAAEVPANSLANCAACQASIRLCEGDFLCAGCGAPRRTGALCSVCGHDGVLFPSLGVLMCPVCRAGALHIEAIPR